MFYRIRTSKFGWREFREGNPLVAAGIAYFVKLLGADTPASMDDPNVDDPKPFEMSPESLPASLQEMFQPLRTQLESMGFQAVTSRYIQDSRHSQMICQLDFRHPHHPVLARIHHRRWDVPHPAKSYLFPVFISGYSDGSYVLTSGGRFDCLSPAQVQATYYKDAALATVWEHHQQSLTAKNNSAPLFLPDAEAALNFIHSYHALVLKYHTGRGVWVPLPPEEQPEAVTTDPGGNTIDPLYASVLSQIKELRRKKTSWLSGLVVLFVTILLFLGAGSLRWDWKYVLMLIPVLLIHEAGHFIAMRIFGYQNVRMFFIPFFGAAVTGQRFNVAAWKKVVVSLAGPVPGILLGTILGIIGLITHQAWMLQFSMLCLILNGFNLLPLLPLDGGWVVHVLYFSRHPYLDVAFRLLAAIGLLALSIFSHDRILMYIAIPMLISLPVVYKVATIIHNLRKQPLPPPLENSDEIPYPTVCIIVDHLKKAFTKGTNTKFLAQQTLEIYEGIHNRPPGVGPTFGLSVAHIGAIALALLMGILVTVGRQGDFAKFFRESAFRPEHEYTCGSSRKVGTIESTNRSIIVAQFATPEKARGNFQLLQTQLPANGIQMVEFGSALFVTQPAEDLDGRKKWVDMLEKSATNVCVETSSNRFVVVALQCLAPTTNVAQQIQDEMRAYFTASGSMNLIPPWQPQDSRSPAVKAEHLKARQTFTKLRRSNGDIYKQPEWQKLQKAFSNAMRRREEAEITRLSKEMEELSARLQKEAAEKLAREDKSLDAKVAEKYLALPADAFNKDSSALMEFGSLLGQLPMEDGKPAPSVHHYGAQYGDIDHAGLLISMHYVSFQKIDDGLPAIAEWFCRQKCVAIRFDIISGNMEDER